MRVEFRAADWRVGMCVEKWDKWPILDPSGTIHVAVKCNGLYFSNRRNRRKDNAVTFHFHV